MSMIRSTRSAVEETKHRERELAVAASEGASSTAGPRVRPLARRTPVSGHSGRGRPLSTRGLAPGSGWRSFGAADRREASGVKRRQHIAEPSDRALRDRVGHHDRLVGAGLRERAQVSAIAPASPYVGAAGSARARRCRPRCHQHARASIDLRGARPTPAACRSPTRSARANPSIGSRTRRTRCSRVGVGEGDPEHALPVLPTISGTRRRRRQQEGVAHRHERART